MVARRANDRLHEAVQRYPDRFSAFAVVPTANPRAGAAAGGNLIDFDRLRLHTPEVGNDLPAGGKRLVTGSRRLNGS